MKFISLDKMKKLREDAKGGNDLAKKILHAQAYGEDFDADLDSYFKPVEDTKKEEAADNTTVPPENIALTVAASSTHAPVDLKTFLANSGVNEGDPDYEETVAEYNEMYGGKEPAPVHEAHEEMDLTKDIAAGIIDLISKCDQTSLMFMQNDGVDDTVKKGAMTSIQEIKQNLLESAEKIKKIKNSLCKKEENALE